MLTADIPSPRCADTVGDPTFVGIPRLQEALSLVAMETGINPSIARALRTVRVARLLRAIKSARGIRCATCTAQRARAMVGLMRWWA